MFFLKLSVDYRFISWIFLRLLALIYIFAFASMAVQIEGLIGTHGILPIEVKLQELSNVIPNQKYWFFPSVFWFTASDSALLWVCYLGVISATSLFIDRASAVSLFVCYILYLSIAFAGQDFTAFQWDGLLLEVGFLAIFLTWGSGWIVFLYQFLLARFMFMSGVVKLASGDPNWSGLTALNYYYQTQPLPSSFAWYAHHLPQWFHKLSVLGVFFIELIVPVLMFIPGKFRSLVALCFVILQLFIILTGNYGFFNFLVIILCLFLFNDHDVTPFLSKNMVKHIYLRSRLPGLKAHISAVVFTAVVLMVCGADVWQASTRKQVMQPLAMLQQTVKHLSIINNYGPFAVMTTIRREIIIEGSNDGNIWFPYHFKYKPGNVEKALTWVIPHQPRLDWLMWFQALDKRPTDGWFFSFIKRIKEGSPQVTALLAGNPFPTTPPNYVRALIYQYRFTTPQERRINGQIWQSNTPGIYWTEFYSQNSLKSEYSP